MAGFIGIQWAEKQMLYHLKDKTFSVLSDDAKVFPVSRSIHYGLFLAFEGIRFYCKKKSKGTLQLNFLNLDKNLARFQRGISFNLGKDQQLLVPAISDLQTILLDYFKDPAMTPFLQEMADMDAQGYLRPFTFDEAKSIGVTFPENPSIRAVVCRYDGYLGEPFNGVVVPHMVRAVGANGTGCLKLGVNYLMSVKAVDEAKKIDPEAGSALFLDDRYYDSVEDRKVTEWDSSCCLFALRDGTVVKIPESNLILPSITIQGICAILKQMNVTVVERDMSYGELIERVKKDEVVAICSVGTAGILNRAEKLVLVDDQKKTLCIHKVIKNHELYKKLDEARTYYWNIYKEKAAVPIGLSLQTFDIP